MKQLTPSLWFDKNCEEAMNFYVSAFPDSKIVSIMNYPEGMTEEHMVGMEGKVLHGMFELGGKKFVALDGGPYFTFNSSISFFVNFDPSRDDKAAENLQALWDKLVDGGKTLMDVGEYPHSKKYGWVQDKYGVNWQLMLTNPDGEERPFITPSLLFAGESTNKAEAAIEYYLSVFKDARKGTVARYPEDTGPAKKDSLMYADFNLEGTWFVAMDSGVNMDAKFNEAISFIIDCKGQEEIDYYWDKLSAVPESEQCGWVKDKFGVSWQIIPENMGDLLKTNKAMEAMLKMKKIIIADLEAAGKE